MFNIHASRERSGRTGPQECRYGLTCRHETCTYAHPPGWNPSRNRTTYQAGHVGQQVCRDFLNCPNPACTYRHPPGWNPQPARPRAPETLDVASPSIIQRYANTEFVPVAGGPFFVEDLLWTKGLEAVLENPAGHDFKVCSIFSYVGIRGNVCSIGRACTKIHVAYYEAIDCTLERNAVVQTHFPSPYPATSSRVFRQRTGTVHLVSSLKDQKRISQCKKHWNELEEMSRTTLGLTDDERRLMSIQRPSQPTRNEWASGGPVLAIDPAFVSRTQSAFQCTMQDFSTFAERVTKGIFLKEFIDFTVTVFTTNVVDTGINAGVLNREDISRCFNVQQCFYVAEPVLLHSKEAAKAMGLAKDELCPSIAVSVKFQLNLKTLEVTGTVGRQRADVKLSHTQLSDILPQECVHRLTRKFFEDDVQSQIKYLREHCLRNEVLLTLFLASKVAFFLERGNVKLPENASVIKNDLQMKKVYQHAKRTDVELSMSLTVRVSSSRYGELIRSALDDLADSECGELVDPRNALVSVLPRPCSQAQFVLLRDMAHAAILSNCADPAQHQRLLRAANVCSIKELTPILTRYAGAKIPETLQAHDRDFVQSVTTRAKWNAGNYERTDCPHFSCSRPKTVFSSLYNQYSLLRVLDGNSVRARERDALFSSLPPIDSIATRASLSLKQRRICELEAYKMNVNLASQLDPNFVLPHTAVVLSMDANRVRVKFLDAVSTEFEHTIPRAKIPSTMRQQVIAGSILKILEQPSTRQICVVEKFSPAVIGQEWRE